MQLVHDSSYWHLLVFFVPLRQSQSKICGDPSVSQQWHLNYLHMRGIFYSSSPQERECVCFFIEIYLVFECLIRNGHLKTMIRTCGLVDLLFKFKRIIIMIYITCRGEASVFVYIIDRKGFFKVKLINHQINLE